MLNAVPNPSGQAGLSRLFRYGNCPKKFVENVKSFYSLHTGVENPVWNVETPLKIFSRSGCGYF